MLELQSQPTTEGSQAFFEDEICETVLDKQPSYSKGLGSDLKSKSRKAGSSCLFSYETTKNVGVTCPTNERNEEDDRENELGTKRTLNTWDHELLVKSDIYDQDCSSLGPYYPKLKGLVLGQSHLSLPLIAPQVPSRLSLLSILPLINVHPSQLSIALRFALTVDDYPLYDQCFKVILMGYGDYNVEKIKTMEGSRGQHNETSPKTVSSSKPPLPDKKRARATKKTTSTVIVAKLPTQYAYHFEDKNEWGAGNIITQDGIHSFLTLG
uniref:Uncharacterized protein n=1 Tax=Cucumis melo TaxID=3656 RepID=A0A9I9E8E8_CUCME